MKNYSGKEFTTEDLLKDEVISRLVGPVPEELLDHAIELQEKTVKKSPKTSEKLDKPKKSIKQDKPKKEASPKKSLEDRSNEDINHNKCLCRLWKNGLDNIQCSGNKIDGTDFCKRHGEFGTDWWCGLITEPRPESPVGPSTKPEEKQSRHYWSDQEKPSKKKKKSTEKKVEEPVSDNSEDIKIAGGVGDIPETSNESTEDKVENKEDDEETSEEISESDEENEDTRGTTDFEIDGVIYKRLMKDDLIMDCKSGMQMAYLKEGKFTEFFNDDAKKLHENYKK